MTDELKLNLKSMCVSDEKKAQLKQLFPEVFTESKVDFERLKQVLGENIETSKERYGMTWAGKGNCFKIIQEPSVGTLKPCRDESVNFDETENLYIEGDNLEVLKLLQKSYYGKVKMIYIDPPYNTGNEFIYPDNFTESLDTYLKFTGQKDSEGRKFSTNVETDGRFHSKWMNMMYTRLYLSRNLLREDGVILVSIGGEEVKNNLTLLEEIYGEENKIAILTWEKGRKNDSTFFSDSVEYLLVFAKDRSLLAQNGKWREKKDGLKEVFDTYNGLRKKFKTDHSVIEEKMREYYRQLPDEAPQKEMKHFFRSDDRGLYFGADISSASTSIPDYEIYHPTTKKSVKKPSRGWGATEPVMLQRITEGRVLFGEDETTIPLKKSYLEEVDSIVKTPVLYKDGRAATVTLKALLGDSYFENPKDHSVLADLTHYVFQDKKDGIVIDFFSGSASTAHAIMDLNVKASANIKYIMIQLPEQCSVESDAFKAGYKTIADIGKERIRRTSKKIKEKLDTKLDLGLKVFKLSQSNFKVWETGHNQDVAGSLKLYADHIDPKSKPEDILYEILLKSGFELTTKVEKIKVEGKEIFSIEEGAMFIYLGDGITKELTYAIAEKSPSRFVCLDHSFHHNDQLKTNTVQLMKSRNIEFRTV